MKIHAIRVRDVGHFSAPTALEGLSGGLDVLAAGNEAGKSTLFRALEVAFFEKHTGAGERIKGITPRTGGSPLIEVITAPREPHHSPLRARVRML